MKRILLLPVFLFFAFTVVSSQEEFQNADSLDIEYFDEYDVFRVHFIDVSLSVYSPYGAFSDKVDADVLFGFSSSYLYQVKLEKAAFIGAEFYYGHLGAFSRNYEGAIGNEVIPINGKMTSKFLGLNLLIRYYPAIKIGPIEPFFEGQFGGKWMNSTLSEGGTFSDEEPYSSYEVVQGTFKPVYGGALGLQSNLNENLYLSLKGSYSVSSSGEYYTKADLSDGMVPEFPIDGFDLVKSTTDFIKIDFGITYLY